METLFPQKNITTRAWQIHHPR